MKEINNIVDFMNGFANYRQGRRQSTEREHPIEVS